MDGEAAAARLGAHEQLVHQQQQLPRKPRVQRHERQQRAKHVACVAVGERGEAAGQLDGLDAVRQGEEVVAGEGTEEGAPEAAVGGVEVLLRQGVEDGAEDVGLRLVRAEELKEQKGAAPRRGHAVVVASTPAALARLGGGIGDGVGRRWLRRLQLLRRRLPGVPARLAAV